MSTDSSQVHDFKTRLKEKEDILDATIAKIEAGESADLKEFSEDVSAICKEINECSDTVRADMQSTVQNFTKKLQNYAVKMQEASSNSTN